MEKCRAESKMVENEVEFLYEQEKKYHEENAASREQLTDSYETDEELGP
jgi:hypothetical protein